MQNLLHLDAYIFGKSNSSSIDRHFKSIRVKSKGIKS